MELSEYEVARQVRMEENAAYLESLGLGNKRKECSKGNGSQVLESESMEEERGRRRLEKRKRMANGQGIDEVCAEWPGREAEIRMLAALIGSTSSCLVCIGGPSGTGKSAISRAVLEASGEAYAWINCASLPRGAAPKALAAATVAQGVRSLLSASFESKAAKKSKRGYEDAIGLTEACTVLAASHNEEGMTATIVLDEAGLVLAPPWSIKKGNDEIEAELIAAFSHAQAVVAPRVALRIFFIGDDRALAGCFLKKCFSQILRIHFSAYSSNDTKKVLFFMCKRRALIPPGLETDFIRFIDHITTISRRTTSDLRDLVKIASSKPLFAFFRAQGDQAYQSVLPVLSAALDRLHDPYLDVDQLLAPSHQTFIKKPKSFFFLQEFSISTKLLLLASYIATHSSRDSDKKFFTTAPSSSALRTKKKSSDHSASTGDHLTKRLAPQPAPLERILSIHAYILASTQAAHRQQHHNLPMRNPAILQALAALIHNKVIERYGASEDLSQLRFKCLLSDDTAFSLASVIHFPLANYLPAARHM